MNINTFSHRLNLKYPLPLFFMIAMFLLASCGGGSGGTPTTGPTPTATTASIVATVTNAAGTITPAVTVTTSGVCSLVTTAQAGMILGAAVQTTTNTVNVQGMPVNNCVYFVSLNGSSPSAGISEAVEPDTTTAQTIYTELQQVVKTQNPTAYQDISGIGDQAFTDGSVLYIRKGKTVLIITVKNTGSAKILPDEKLFAQDALANVS